MDKKINLLNMNRTQLCTFFSKLGGKKFYAKQVMRWIYHHYCDDFDRMTDLNRSFRNVLKKVAEIRAPILLDQKYSLDGTIKWYLKVGNEQVETIYIPENTRSTLCISSQIGCLLQCTFCATGQQGFSRNLNVFEIIGQIWSISRIIYTIQDITMLPIRNVVIMGMGEPLLNFKNIITSIDIMLDDFGFGFSKRRVTLSTSGIVPGLKKLADRKIDISLAISLHASNNEIRNSIMPVNQKWDINALIVAIKYYLSKFNTIYYRRVTIEYVMLDNINDDIKYAHQLANRLCGIPCKINLIPWNVIPNVMYRCSSVDRINKFAQILMKYGLITTIRKIRGDDIGAACGQLTGLIINRKKCISIL